MLYTLNVAAPCKSEACLIWPFGKCKKQGYAKLRYNKNSRNAARFICEVNYGPPPTPEHHAAHSCGKGHDACVNGSHITWKTPTENQQDRGLHGTKSEKENHPNARLTATDVASIRAVTGAEPQTVTAERFGVSQVHVSNIQRFKKWKRE